MPAYTPIKLTGRLDTTRVGEIETEFYANIGAVKEGEAVLIDLRDVDFVSSLGIRMLITAGKLLLRRKVEAEHCRTAIQVGARGASGRRRDRAFRLLRERGSGPRRLRSRRTTRHGKASPLS